MDVFKYASRIHTDISLLNKFSQLQHVSFGNENEDGFICPYLCLSKLHDNFPVGYVVYLLKAEVNRQCEQQSS